MITDGDRILVTDYQRVIPRDLFNEAKLLKCLGQLSLLVHAGRDKNGMDTPPSLVVLCPCLGFTVAQDQSSGCLVCLEFEALVGLRKIQLYSSCNSKSAYPLVFEDGDESGEVFNEDGTLADEFIQMCNR